MKILLLLALLLPLEIHADEIAKLTVNAKAIKCEPFEKTELGKLSQTDLESIYCGYLIGIRNTDLAQVKEFEKYANDINTKLAISEKNNAKNIQCISYKSEVEYILTSADPPYVAHCENYEGFSDLLK